MAQIMAQRRFVSRVKELGARGEFHPIRQPRATFRRLKELGEIYENMEIFNSSAPGRERAQALSELSRLLPEERAAPILLNALHNPEPKVREEAVKILRLKMHEPAIPSIASLLGDESVVAFAATEALIRMGNSRTGMPEAVERESILVLSAAKDRITRYRATRVLGGVGGKQSAELLGDLLKTEANEHADVGDAMRRAYVQIVERCDLTPIYFSWYDSVWEMLFR